ncbi:MAG: hypothetical protein JW832_04355 [Deltaproteobacteria bacterium]|nr:hypothetical protein [Deltaproteobacteria bacterium]
MKKNVFCAVWMLAGSLLAATAARGLEPQMINYSSHPIFQSASVMPNILVMLDNSGSMSFPAYPDPYNPDVSGISYGTVLTGASFKGGACQVSFQVADGLDDAEERLIDNKISYCGFDYRKSADLDMSKDDIRASGSPRCYNYEEQVVGLRFRNIDVPSEVNGEPVVITSAKIYFTAYAGSGNLSSNPATLYITAEASDDAAPFTADAGNISGRPEVDASKKVTWANVGRWYADSGANADTPDLKELVQEILARPGWVAGNDMVFKITGAPGSRRRAYAFESGASKSPLLVITYEPCVAQKYYGYFNPDARYSYSSNVFVRDPAGAWSGNFLNWVSMRRIDVLRKALMGGKRPCESCSGVANLEGETPAQESRYWQTYYDGAGVSPYLKAWYGVKGGNLYVKASGADIADGKDPWDSPTGTYVLKVEITQANEPEAFCTTGSEEGNPCGIIQKVGDQARWGNIWFYDANNEGGVISSPIGGGIRDIINDFQSTDMRAATPLSETLYTAMKYFAQSPGLPSGYASNALPSPVVAGSVKDPFYDKGEIVECAKSFTLMLTDGVPTSDTNIPDAFKNYDGDTNETTRTYDGGGSDYLDDVALYSHVEDLRSDLADKQTMDTFVVYAFGKDPVAKNLLMETAMAGGFDDRNINKKPDGYANNGVFDQYPPEERVEWDRDGDAVPDNFYEAQDGYMLEKQLLAAINAILNKAASGTAVSVLATTGEGEGTLVQAIFRPGITAGLDAVSWIGFLQSLWVDPKGNIREDTNKNSVLEVDIDRVVSYYFDQGNSETRVKRYEVSASNPYPDKATATSDNISLEELGATAIWEAGRLLSSRNADERKIYTYVGDGAAMASPLAFGSGSCVEFSSANMAAIQPFLGVQDTVENAYTYMGSTFDIRTANLINFIRGSDSNGDGVGASPLQGPVSVRKRMLDGKVWKLGDIVYSTPVTITRPVERYSLIYDDKSYQAFMNKYGDNATTARESVVYVGANDGMLHAFTGGVFDKESHGFVRKSGTSERIGDELWAYIPRALLPHLKWLASPNYDMSVHVPYVDLKPKIIDVRIFDDDEVHPGGWGTVLVGGMNYGGKYIWVNRQDGTGSASYAPSYFAIDITDPRNPKLLWDRWFPGLGLTVNQPTVMSVGRTFDTATRTWNNDDAWFLAIGSGYDDFNGWTLGGQAGSLYIVDIKTGELKRQFQTAEPFCYMNTPITIDKSLNYSVDVIYAAGNYSDTTDWSLKSKVYRVGIPITNSPYIEGFEARYNKDPASWIWSKMVDDPGLPTVSAPFTISSDKKDNVWLYLGSGRYQSIWDKGSSTQNWLVGVKDPFYNRRGTVPCNPLDTTCVAPPACYHSYTTSCTVSHDDLFYSNPYTMKPANAVQVLSGGITGLTTWDKLMNEVLKIDTGTGYERYQGWYRKMATSGTDPSERMINKPTVFGGIALFPAYTPNTDICGFGGTSRLYALYYETGTAYRLPVLTGLDNTVEIQYQADLGYGLSSSFGVHAAKEKGGAATLYSQMSTGLINEITIQPAFSTKSGVENWKEGR